MSTRSDKEFKTNNAVAFTVDDKTKTLSIVKPKTAVTFTVTAAEIKAFEASLASTDKVLSVEDKDGQDMYDIFVALLAYTGPNFVALRYMLIAFILNFPDDMAKSPNRFEAISMLYYVLVAILTRGPNFGKAMKKMSAQGKDYLEKCMKFFESIMMFPGAGEGGKVEMNMLTPARLFLCVPDIVYLILDSISSQSRLDGKFTDTALLFPGSIILFEDVAEGDAEFQEYCAMMWSFDQQINSGKNRKAVQLKKAYNQVYANAVQGLTSPIRKLVKLRKAEVAKGARTFSRALETKEKKKAKEDEEEEFTDTV